MKRIFRFFLVFAMAVSLLVVAYQDSLQAPVIGAKGHYTYTYADEDPGCLNPLGELTTQAKEILSYTTSPLYEFTLAKNDCGYEMTPVLAEAAPEDVTEDYAGNEVYGIPAKAKTGYAWKVTLREDAIWQDGSAITTEDFVFALQKYLSTGKTDDQSRAFYQGDLALANAAAYVKGQSIPVYDGTEQAKVAEEEMYVDLNYPLPALKKTSILEYYGRLYPDQEEDFYAESGENILAQLMSEATDGIVALNDKTKALLNQLYAINGKESNTAYLLLCMYRNPNPVTWDQVGFQVLDEKNMVFLLKGPATAEELGYGLLDLYLLNQDIYERDPQSYGTSMDTYASYGPYRLTSYDSKTGMDLARNTNWFGYEDEAFRNQYQTTDISILYGLDESEEELKFHQGSLLRKNLGVETSNNAIYKSDATTRRYVYVIQSDMAFLDAKNKEGENHSLLAYKDFRRALFYAIDRESYAPKGAEITYGLLSDQYISDIAKGQTYRGLASVQSMLNKIYGTAQDEEKIVSYNPEAAATFLKTAYLLCLEDGNMKDTDKVVFTFRTDREDTESALDFLQKTWDAAAKGTELEGRIVIIEAEEGETPDIYEAVVEGEDWDPYVAMQPFVDGSEYTSNGLYPQSSKIGITLSGEVKKASLANWMTSLNEGLYRRESRTARSQIVTDMEKVLLSTFSYIPLYSEQEGYLLSDRVRYKSDTSVNSVVGYGGIRDMVYIMDDAEWAKYCKIMQYSISYE